MASCATSSESARFLKSHLARLKAASRCGRTSCSKRARSCTSNTSGPLPWSEPLIRRNRLRGDFIPEYPLDETNQAGVGNHKKAGITKGPRWSAQTKHVPYAARAPWTLSPAPPSKQIGGNGRYRMVTDTGVSKSRGGSNGG